MVRMNHTQCSQVIAKTMFEYDKATTQLNRVEVVEREAQSGQPCWGLQHALALRSAALAEEVEHGKGQHRDEDDQQDRAGDGSRGLQGMGCR